MFKVIDNFLEEKDFSGIQTKLLSPNFPWYYNDYVNYENEKSDYFQFTFTFINNGEYKCVKVLQDLLIPVLKNIMQESHRV